MPLSAAVALQSYEVSFIPDIHQLLHAIGALHFTYPFHAVVWVVSQGAFGEEGGAWTK